MNEQSIALGALVILLSLGAGALFSRWYFAPTGSHRAPRVVEEQVPFADLLRPTAAGVNDFAFCPAEEQDRLHRFNGDGTRTCWTCRCETPTAVPRG
ncbi:hypothetical protein [Streptomyces sp. NPDC008137]|uniref:hypothetical protein n=1 Tax=Streptomyces sp. NPDC008137 TaxID=3364813 RepID=UPI0036E70D6D